MKNFHYILGSNDPEMLLIAFILESMGYSYEYATVDGQPVHPTNAYKLNNDINTDKITVFIECFNPTFTGQYISIDHHNEGDYGYNLGADNFLEAASVGQLFKFILNNDFENAVRVFNLKTTTNNLDNDYMFVNNNWTLTTDKGTVIIPENIVVTAGIDHCSFEAYEGLCLGITEKGLISQRVQDLSDNLNIDFTEVQFQLHYYIDFLQVESNSKEEILDLTHLEVGTGYSKDYLILREAAIISQTPIAVKTYNNSECNGKFMFLALSENQVEEVMSNSSFNGTELRDMFGVPSRRYAGGMVV